MKSSNNAEKQRKKPANTRFTGFRWRKRWDSNPRTLADQLISSQSRYDHFDTLPNLSQHQDLRKWGELMGRTEKNIKLRIPEKPRKIKDFRLGGYQIATTISSQPRYDHFDISAYLIVVLEYLSTTNILYHIFFQNAIVSEKFLSHRM